MGRPLFEKLEVYCLSERLADMIWEIVKGWDQFAKFAVGTQLTDAADSIGANIAEGTGRWNYKDNQRFVRIARGSLYETQHWLRRAFRRELLSQTQIDALKTILDELSPRLNAYLKSIGRKHREPKPQSGDDPSTTHN